jgi:Cytochrome c554 and c-prime
MRQLNFFIAAMRGSWRKRLLAGLGVLLAFAVLQFGAARLTQAQQGGSDFDHASTGYVLNAQHQNVRCETCHTNGTFKGTPKDCVSCHGWNNPRAKSSVMPTTHIPTGNASCESCHAAAQAQFSDASRTFNHATVVTLTCVNCHSSRNPHPGVVTNPNDATHVAAFALNQGCDKCHTTAQFSGTKVPANHIPTAAVACSSCHIGGDYKQKPTVSNIHAFAPSTSSNCVQCHSAASAAFYRTADMVIPSPATVGNHIPMGSRSCESCHVGAGSSITNTPVTEGSAFGGSLFDHAGATVSCATCHGASVTPTTFYGVSPRAISDLQPAHVPTSAACETCHLSGAPAGLVPAAGMTTFANAQFSHTGISSGCATCHGPTLGNSSFYGVTNLIVMPATSPAGNLSHMPTSTTCESCHAASTPSSPVPAVSPRALGSSLFRNGPPTSGMIHSGVSAGCGACHGGTSTWVGVDLPIYTRNFNTVQAGSGVLYTGFQTLPGSGGTYSIPDSGHPNNDTCEQCHTSTTAFGGISLPSGHIPYVAGVGCGVCHDSSFSTSPSIAAIHSNIQSRASNCEQCHSTDNAALYASTTKRRAIKTPTPNHVPMGSLGCASCHVGANTGIPITPVTASSFAGAGFLHTGISSGCVNCHGANVAAGTFDGVTPTSVSGQTPVHIPVSSNIGCETCHANSIPPGLVTTSGYTGPTFAGGKYIHTGVTTGCATCHGAGVGPFKGVSNLVLMPSTAAPNGHIPSSSACESCHLASVPTGLLAVSGSPTSPPGTGFANAPPNGSLIHADVSGGCNSCHEAGNSWLGMSAYRPTPSAKNTTNPAQLYTGFHTRPGTAGGYSMADSSHPAGTGECSVCHGNTVAFGLPSLPTKHIPFASTASCAACHVSWGTSPTIADIHNNLQSASTNCAQCHSDANATAYSTANRAIMRPASNHVPMRTLGCESCHVGAGTGIVNTPVTATSFAGGLFSHSGMGTNCAECHGPAVTGFQGITRIAKMPPTTPAGSIASHIPSSTTCENCHLGSMPSSRIAANAAVLPPGSGFLQSPPVSALIHTGVSGGCSNCHDTNMEWMGVGAYPKQVSPRFTGFHSRPQGGVGTYWVTDAVHPAGGDCSSCHTGFTEWSTNVKPANHIPTANVACANCHTSANYSDMPLRDAIHANAQSTTANCAQCHSAANALLYNTTAMTIKAPASNHIPMGNLGCESCHVGSNSSLMTPVGRTAVFSNSAFSHTGVTSGCATCHGNIDGSTFQGGQIPVTMTTPALTPVHVPNPANLDCGSCHLAIPTGLSRIGSTSTTFAGGKYSHSGISNGCDACHVGSGTNSMFKGITAIVVLPPTTSGASNHIPSPINAKCETCHMGSMPTTLVNASATVTTPGSTKFKTPTPPAP